jgi:RNA polymerase sigma-70 factor (ECF subfamily)
MSSADLMQRYCEGDNDAFPTLYREVAPRLRGHLRFLLRDDAAAEDVLQKTFLKLHGARSKYVRGMDPVPWIFAIGCRAGIDEMRRRAKSLLRPLRDSEDWIRVAEATAGDFPTSGVTEESHGEAERSAVLQALDELPPRQRAALTLTKFQGLTISDAARTLGTTESAVKLRAHRAYARLREVLGRDDLFHERLEASVERSRRTRESRAGAGA